MKEHVKRAAYFVPLIDMFGEFDESSARNSSARRRGRHELDPYDAPLTRRMCPDAASNPWLDIWSLASLTTVGIRRKIRLCCARTELEVLHDCSSGAGKTSSPHEDPPELWMPTTYLRNAGSTRSRGKSSAEAPSHPSWAARSTATSIAINDMGLTTARYAICRPTHLDTSSRAGRAGPASTR